MTARAEEQGTARSRYLPALLRTTAFKLSLAYLLIFALCAVLTLGYVAWTATHVLDDQIVDTVEAEITGLAEQYRLGGIRRLVAIVDRRGRQPGASLYLVTTFQGERVAGNVGSLPPGTLDNAGQREVDYSRTEDETRDHHAIVRVFILPGGFRLLVGRDVEERARIREIIGRAIGGSLLLLGLLGCAGAWFITKRILRRVDEMTGTTEIIMAGDLTGRLPIAGTGDELDRLAHNLNAMLDRIGELMTGLGEVSNNIAHDLKTPLTRLRNKADEALRGPAEPAALRAALEGVIEESDNLIRVFNALLLIARLEAKGAEGDAAEFDLAEVAASVVELYEPLAEDAGLTLNLRTEPATMLKGNRELIGQALANLLDNAIKYGKPPADETSTSVAAVDVEVGRDDTGVTLQVSDRGAGIAPADRERVLDRFVRLESARTSPGFGLGLSLVTAVMRMHGGTLSLHDNEPGLRVRLSFGPPAPFQA